MINQRGDSPRVKRNRGAGGAPSKASGFTSMPPTSNGVGGRGGGEVGERGKQERDNQHFISPLSDLDFLPQKTRGGEQVAGVQRAAAAAVAATPTWRSGGDPAELPPTPLERKLQKVSLMVALSGGAGHFPPF